MDIKTRTEEYFKKEFQMDICLKAVKSVGNIPETALAAYDIWTSTWTGMADVCFVASAVDEYGPAEAVKVVNFIYERVPDYIVIFLTEDKDWYEYFRAFRYNHMNLVVPGRLVFCPDLFIVIRKHRTVRERRKDEKKIQPYAQCILIRQMLIGDMDGFDIERCAKLLEVTYGTAQKAVKWLIDEGYLMKDGKNIHFPEMTKEYCMKAVSIMESPIKKEVWVARRPDGMICGEHAMDHYTMLVANGEPDIACVGEIKNEKMPDGLGTKVCIWKYNPKLTSDNEYVDPISLYLTMKDSDDERIRIESKKLINNIYNGKRN